MPDYKLTGLSVVKRTAQDDYRFTQLNEISELKNLLVKRGINIDQNTLKKAILLPEDVVFDEGKRKIPGPGITLMVNPFPKRLQKSKKGKNKKDGRNTTFNRSRIYIA